MAYGYGDDYDDFEFGSDDIFDREDSFSERYDMSNGAPFGTFDFDGDGELDILEKTAKLNHYQSLWEDEDKTFSDDSDIFLDDLIEDDEDHDYNDDYLYARSASNSSFDYRPGISEDTETQEIDRTLPKGTTSDDYTYIGWYPEEEGDSIYSHYSKKYFTREHIKPLESDLLGKLESDNIDDFFYSMSSLYLYYVVEHAKKLHDKYEKRIPELVEITYNQALDDIHNDRYYIASKKLNKIKEFKDVKELINECTEEAEKQSKRNWTKFYIAIAVIAFVIVLIVKI